MPVCIQFKKYFHYTHTQTLTEWPWNMTSNSAKRLQPQLQQSRGSREDLEDEIKFPELQTAGIEEQHHSTYSSCLERADSHCSLQCWLSGLRLGSWTGKGTCSCCSQKPFQSIAAFAGSCSSLSSLERGFSTQQIVLSKSENLLKTSCKSPVFLSWHKATARGGQLNLLPLSTELLTLFTVAANVWRTASLSLNTKELWLTLG